MNELLVISGPPCSGKTFLINNLKENQVVLERIGFYPPFKFVNANQVRSKKDFTTGSVVVHYDCLRSFKRSLEIEVNSDKLLSYINNHDRVSFVFIINPFDILLTRINERYNRLKNTIDLSRRRNLQKLIALYNNKTKFETEYLKWYEFTTKCKTVSNYIVYNGFENSLNNNFIKIKGNKFIDALKKGKLT